MEAQMFRISSYRIHQSLVQKPLRLSEYWPLWADKKEEEEFVMTKEMYEEIKKAHKLN